MTSRFSSFHNSLFILLLVIISSSCQRADKAPPGTDPETGPLPTYDAAAPPSDATPIRPQFRSCLDLTLPEDLPEDLPEFDDWSNPLNEVITLGDPWHSAQDVIAVTDRDTLLAGKFSYGDVSKDLEGERIEVWIDECGDGYRRLGEDVSDSDGRIALTLAAAELPAVGAYQLQFRVMGDGSTAGAVLRVYPPTTKFAVFDIDATLTTSDSELADELIFEILGGRVAVPTARASALELVTLRFAEQGYELIYLTGRPYLLDALTRRWLDDLGFPGGTVHLTDDFAQSWPSDSVVGDYKADFLRQVSGYNFDIEIAYGNATSDIYAYEQAEIAKSRTYILGDNGGSAETVALGEDYVVHFSEVREEPAISQPFTR